MDLNDLIQREGEERMRAGQAGSRSAQLAHLTLAEMYRDRIDFRRRARLDEARLGPELRRPAR